MMRDSTSVAAGIASLMVLAGLGGPAAAKVPPARLPAAVSVPVRADDEGEKGEKKGKGGDKAEKKGKPSESKGEQKGEKKGEGEKGEGDKAEKLPKAVATAVKTIFPGMKVVKVEKEDEDGDVLYEVTLRSKAGTLEAKLNPKGRVVEVELKKGEDGEENEKGEGKRKGEDDEKGEGKDKKKGEGKKKE